MTDSGDVEQDPSPVPEDVFQSWAPHPYQMLNPDGEILAVNDAWIDSLGYDRDAVLERWFGDFLTEGSRHKFETEFEEYKATGEAAAQEYEIRCADGDTIFVIFDGRIQYDSDGNVVRTHCQFTDITSKKQREAFIEKSPDLIVLIDQNGRVQYVSPAVNRELGYDPEDLIGRQAFEDVHPDDREGAMEMFTRILENPETVEGARYRLREADGSWRWVESRGKNLLDEASIDGVIINTRVIEERKAYDRRLHREKERAEQFFETAGNILVLLDLEGKVSRINTRGSRLLGYETEELLGEDWFEAVLPKEIEPGVTEVFSKLVSGTLDGVEKHTNYIQTKSGERRYIQWHNTPFRDPNGEMTGILSSGVDITERKEYEQKLEEQRDDLTVLNQVLRHDIRNNLQLVSAYADMLAGEVREDNREYVEIIQENARQAVDLTKTARDMAEVMLSEDANHHPVALKSPLRTEVEEFQSTYPHVAITVDGPIPSVRVRCTEMLNSVFHNILQNAVEHNDKDIPHVRISVNESEETVRVRIADNGPGIPDGQKETIFGKGEHGLESAGTGLGLYLVQKIIEKSGGEVWVEDSEPEGSVFVVELPKADSDSE